MLKDASSDLVQRMIGLIGSEAAQKGFLVPTFIQLALPWREFETLCAFIRRGDAMILGQAGKWPVLAIMLLTSGERVWFQIYRALAVFNLASVVFAVLSVAFSWWFLFGVPVSFIAKVLMSNLCCKAVARTASSSEEGFCLLYTIGAIHIVDLMDGTRYQLKNPSR